jgi:hypothetical protein
MPCECYQVGGPWITFDPDCPAHGHEAQRAEAEREAADQARDEEIRQLRLRIEELERILRDTAPQHIYPRDLPAGTPFP